MVTVDVQLLRRKYSSAKYRTASALLRRWAPYNADREIFDTSFWTSIPPFDAAEFAWGMDGLPAPTGMPWELPEAGEFDPTAVAAACHSETGFWPISFSIPVLPEVASPDKTRLMSEVMPGRPYTYTDEARYYRQYAESQYALTFRKAGWDCFRHVEILSTGCIPVMPDIDRVPRFSMVHYPKNLLRSVVSHLKLSGDGPSGDLGNAVRNHVVKHLTSRAMAEYLLEHTGLAQAERVLFVDDQLPTRVDYLSAFSLIGLKQLLGRGCVTWSEVPYLYDDWKGSTASLYGRGFGYAKRLHSDTRARGRSRQWVSDGNAMRRFLGNYDAVIVGSIARNGPLAYRLLESFPAQQTVWIHGEDQAPSPREQHYLTGSGTNVFVRAVPDANSAALSRGSRLA